MQKRSFWSAYVLECTAAVFLGRPLSLHLQEIDVEVSFNMYGNPESMTKCSSVSFGYRGIFSDPGRDMWTSTLLAN